MKRLLLVGMLALGLLVIFSEAAQAGSSGWWGPKRVRGPILPEVPPTPMYPSAPLGGPWADGCPVIVPVPNSPMILFQPIPPPPRKFRSPGFGRRPGPPPVEAVPCEPDGECPPR